MLRVLPWLLFLVLPLIAFGGSLFHGFAPIDDSFLVVNNLGIRGIALENLHRIFTSYDPELYIPLTFLSFQINYVISGLDPLGFHLGNLVLHIVNGGLVWWLLTLLLNRCRNRSAPTDNEEDTYKLQAIYYKLSALAAALVFSIHPLHTEAVVWIAGRKDVLSTMFALLSFIGYIKYRDSSRLWIYIGSLACFALALLSKVMPVTLPAILVLYEILKSPHQIVGADRHLHLRRMLFHILPYALLSLFFLVVALGGKERIVEDLTLLETILMAGKSIPFYIQKFLLPFNLSVFYPFTDPISLTNLSLILSGVVTLGLGMCTLYSICRFPLIAFGLLFYLIALSPTLLHFQKGSEVFFAVDRYAYWPSVGLVLLVAVVLVKLFQNRSQGRLLLVVGILILVLTSLSHLQTRVWSSHTSLITHALEIYPESVAARYDLARFYREQGAYERGFEILKEGLLYEEHPQLFMGAGYIYLRTGQIRDAVEQFSKAKTLDPKNPEPIFALASVELHLENRDRARELFEKAVEMDPSYVVARTHLADMYAAEGRLEEARTHYQEALEWNPDSLEAREGLDSL